MNEDHKVKNALLDENVFLKTIIQNAAAPIFVIDSSHKIIIWNNALAKLTGKSSFQMVGTRQQWAPFYPTKRPALADLVIDQQLSQVNDYYTTHSYSQFTEGSFRAEGWYENLGGKRRYIFFEAAPIKNCSNEIIAAVETLEDITDRKIAEEMTKDRNLFLQEVMDAIPNPVYFKDVQGAYLGCNDAFKSYFGKTADEIIGKTLHDLVPESYSGLSTKKDQTIIESGTSLQYETELVRGDGLVRTVYVCKAPLLRSDGALEGIVGSFVDISEKLEMDKNIRKMSQAIEQSPATIVITNVDGVIEYTNPKFSETTGYSKEEAIGQNPRILKSGEMPAEGYAKMWKTLSAGKEWRGEFHNRRKDGTLYWEFASISPLFDKENLLSGYLANKEDITDRKSIEAELHKNKLELEDKHVELKRLFEQVAHAKKEWEQTLDHLRDFVILTNAEHKIMRCNKLLSEVTGKPIEELVGIEWRDLLSEAGFCFENFNGTSGEICNKTSGRTYDITIFPVEESGLVTGHVVSMNDTTDLHATTKELESAYSELKNAQQQILQQEKMASIGQLAAGVAHEINNPMGFISSNLSTLNKYIDRLTEFIAAADQSLIKCAGSTESDRLNDVRKRLKIDYIMDDARQLIAESQDGAARVRRIVQDLKSFSRVDQVEQAMINLNEALETTINIAWNEIKYVAEINRKFGDIPDILCFPQQLNQVFLNLLINAAHAMEGRQGSITVCTWSEADSVFVSVADTGCGMPDEIQQRIFEPFFTTKEVGKGTGLGLSISYEIIRKHGGEITVESEAGRGATFIVRLPIESPVQKEESL